MLGCDAGHRFDANRRGYLSAIDPTAGITGDTREILEARARFLDLGHYRPIMDAVAASVGTVPSASILDAGSGTGHYLAHVLSVSPDRRGLALDASGHAVAASVARAHSPGLVANTWKPLPVRSDRADVILCVFAPRNAAEFARILRPDGRLIVVTPGTGHLAELRSAGLVIGMQEGKLEALAAALGTAFERSASATLAHTIDMDATAGSMLAGMGPSGHHERLGRWDGGTVSLHADVTVWGVREAS